jgi:hypothetical protein
MDMKCAFLNGVISELYVEQTPGFEDCKKPNHVYKLKKALYGLKQATRAYCERLRDFLLSKGFKMDKVDTTLFTKKGLERICLCAKSIWMTLYLDQQIKQIKISTF